MPTEPEFESRTQSPRRVLLAHTMPMALFLGFLMVDAVLKGRGSSWWLAAPEYWLWPVQTIACGALLLWFRRDYEIQAPRQLALTLGIALLVFAIWISPQIIFRAPPRTSGFDPDFFRAQPGRYWATILFRFARLAIVVPFVEEIFWRGFLLRWLIDEQFERVPFGRFSWFSFTAVAVAFCLAHSRPDWPAALATGALYNAVACRTKSLGSCVLAHAGTNLALGLWIMQTKQWGFW
jgi:CAAX prenyl protease-like protein